MAILLKNKQLKYNTKFLRCYSKHLMRATVHICFMVMLICVPFLKFLQSSKATNLLGKPTLFASGLLI